MLLWWYDSTRNDSAARLFDSVRAGHYLARRSGRQRAGSGSESIALPGMSSEDGPPDPLAQLGRRLDRARAEQRGGAGAPRRDSPVGQQGVAVGLRIGVEFVVAVVVATGLGWALDRWLGTRPWGTILLFFLGVGAGMVSVYRAVAGIQTAVGYRRLDGAAGGERAKAERDEE